MATSGRSSDHIDGRQHLAQIGDLRGCQCSGVRSCSPPLKLCRRRAPGPTRAARPPARRAATVPRRTDLPEAARDVERVPRGARGSSARAWPKWALLGIRQRLWVHNHARLRWISTNSTIYSTATAREPVEAHCGKNRFSLAKKRPSERAKLVWGSPARATRGGSGTPYKKTASETTAIDALGGAKTRL